MPRAISPFAYPNEYWDIVHGCAHGGRFKHVVDNPKAGLSLQQKFYAYRSALRRERDKIRVGVSSLTAEQSSRVEEYLIFAEKTICWVDRNHVPALVTFSNVDEHPDAVLLRKFLAKKEQAPVPPEVQAKLDAALKKLLNTEPVEDPTGGKYG